MNKKQIVSTIGELASYFQQIILDEACYYYDEVTTLEESLSAIEVYLIKAKLYRDAFFVQHGGEQLPEKTIVTSNNVDQLEELVKDYV